MIQESEFLRKTNMDFTTFYNSYYSRFKAMVSRFTQDHTTIHEYTHNILLNALENIDKYDNVKGNIYDWSYRCGYNYVISMTRKKNNNYSKFINNDDVGYSENEYTDCVYDNIQAENDTHIIIQKKQEVLNKKVNMIKKTINTLDTKYIYVLTMREIDGLSYKEIADYLGENINSIKTRVKNGRQKIKDKLEKDFKILDKILLDD